MRSVLSVSLPIKKRKEIEERAGKSKETVSAYILRAIEIEQSLISESDLVKMSLKAKDDYKKGKTKKLKSLADLME